MSNRQRDGSKLRTVVRHSALPVLLLVAIATVIAAIQTGAPLPATSFGFVMFTFVYLSILESIIPHDRAWHPEGWERLRDGLYYAMTMFSGGLARGGILSVGAVVAPLHRHLPLAVEIPVAIVVLSLGSYVYHRLSHRVPWLWKMHGIHHAPRKVNVSNQNLHQFLDAALQLLVTHLPLFLLGLSQQAVFAAIVFRIAQGYAVHANIDVELGWLNYVLGGPEQHRLHHSRDPREVGHYAVDLPVWDLLFDSFTWQPARTPRRVGLRFPAGFPTVRSFVVNQLHPFRRTGYLERGARVGMAIDR
jgi:sterol desaturase/sphingolipid hydroxylase (fatty acid hydroxylase superfamily)